MIHQIKIENVGLSTYNMSESDDEQKELLDRIDLRELLGDNIIKKSTGLAINNYVYEINTLIK